MLVESDRRYRFPVGPAELWDRLAGVEAWPTWWPWLRDFESSGDGFVVGASWRGKVKPPLPYSLLVHVEVVEVVAPERVAVRVRGHIEGEARLELQHVGPGLDEDSPGCEVRLVAALRPAHPALSVAARLAPGIARYGHDWVLDTGARQFRDRALGSS